MIFINYKQLKLCKRLIEWKQVGNWTEIWKTLRLARMYCNPINFIWFHFTIFRVFMFSFALFSKSIFVEVKDMVIVAVVVVMNIVVVIEIACFVNFCSFWLAFKSKWSNVDWSGAKMNKIHSKWQFHQNWMDNI